MANQSKPQAAGGISALVQSASGRVLPLISTAQSYAIATLSTSKAILDRYPPLKAFVYTLGGAAAVPLAVFTGYGAATGAVVLGVAGTAVTFVQGGFLAFGGFILFWFLAGAFVLASILTFWFTLAYFAFQVAKRLEGTA
ncbi:uncharacterized protein SPPG_02507 [Spizellomyces punctatus DAOM BR117]|uniref:Uncharacterized protein n=1 Tax=Spizellomyces punctatus (strain DAOM BR117) TaxID=645134 RepID=A0A0L0HKK6_SPIPD|nr:uncharacterized protein SPPG_02507 [Spizellomyces punctatus DAOM BR117]KND02001.1 hypothetical protein SPPG_02507 [Spizellomyces punctatus DAOM BR117]|eukprot:XP_016610040.1 hypothetical protein SPPG_02507 [Spizellomyces punctatus DAOM BR117]